MKTVRQIMAETNALDNVALMKQMMAWSYERKVRHAEEVVRAFWQRNTEEGRNLHVSVGGLDSITLHYFLQEIGVLVPCISCSTLEQKGVQKVHHRIREEMEEALKKALASDKASVIDCRLDINEMVSPMVAAGHDITDFLLSEGGQC